jgi:hypothetical protein
VKTPSQLLAEHRAYHGHETQIENCTHPNCIQYTKDLNASVKRHPAKGDQGIVLDSQEEGNPRSDHGMYLTEDRNPYRTSRFKRGGF